MRARTRAKQAAKVLLGRTPAGRDATIHPDDVLIVSYPKSGNTWARFLVGNVVEPDAEVGFVDLERRFPNIYQPDARLLRRPRPRILKSHEYFDPRYQKVVYFVRDPRDVVLSYYHFHVKIRMIDEDFPLEQYVGRFLTGDLDGYGSWGEHVGSWLGARDGDADRFLLVRYEDALDRTVAELGRITSFLGIGASQRQLERAVGLSSADRMRQLEREQAWDLDLMSKSRRDKAFVRTASAGNWRRELPPASAVAVATAWGPLMEQLGYSLGVSPLTSTQRVTAQ